MKTTIPGRQQRVAVVTGASRGIGRGIAVELGSEGYTVYCLGRSSRGNLPEGQRPVADGLDCTVDSAVGQFKQGSRLLEAKSDDVS